jgi:hypothetical protein
VTTPSDFIVLSKAEEGLLDGAANETLGANLIASVGILLL